MGMGRWMRALWPFGNRDIDPNAAREAVRSSDKRRIDSLVQREMAGRLLESAEQAAADVRAHNTANRYDDFLRRVVQGRE